MKKILCITLAAVMMFGVLAACGSDEPAAPAPAPEAPAAEAPAPEPPPPEDPPEWDTSVEAVEYVYPTGPRGEGVTINMWCWNDEVYNIAMDYKAANPDFLYDIKLTTYVDTTGEYEQALNTALVTGGSEAPDWFIAEQAFVVNYTKFDFAEFAMPYEQLLGVNPEPLAAAAEINTMIKQAGTNLDGEVVALGFQSTGSAFIYRRSLAEQIWGTDDPAVIQTKIGPGYDKFTEAAAEAKAEGIYMLAGEGDIWQAIRQTPNLWIQNDKLVIDAQKMSYLDVGYTFYNNDYTLKTAAWTEGWFGAMSGEEPVLGYLGPAWLINYVLAGNSGDTYGDWAACLPPEPFCWGGSYSIVTKNANPEALPGIAELIYWITLDATETGMQYGWANGTLPSAGAKDSVASGVVMAKADGTLDFLGGQNAFDVFIPAGAGGTAAGWGPYDRAINSMFEDHAAQYFNGTYADKDEMIAAFQQDVLDTLGFGS